MSVSDGGEVILYDQTGRDNYLRGIMYYGNYRTYAQTVCFINFDNSRDCNRNDFLLETINQLTGYGGTFTGRIVNNMTDYPVDNAEVFINECRSSCTTDLLGNFRLENVPVEQFTVNVNRWGYTPVVSAEFNFNGGMELDAEIRMLHPEMAIDPGQISVELETGQSTTENVGIRNVGDGSLEFSTRLRGAPVAGALWEEMESFDAGAITGDVRLQDVVFLQDHYWFVGGQTSDAPNMLYKVNLDGEVVASWEQQSYSNYGWRNITTDGEYLYGVDSTYIAQINPEDGRVTGLRIPTGLNPCYAITYEAGRDLFWVSSVATDIYAVDRQGNRINTVSNNLRFRISGLGWFEDDPNGYKLYVLNNLRDEDRNPYISLDKVNHETSEVMNVAILPMINDERAGGCSFCNGLYDFTWAFLVQMQAAEDWLRVYEAASDFYWLDVEPMSGTLDPGNALQMDIQFTTGDLEFEKTYQSYLMIEHNTPMEGALWIELSMTVTDIHGVTDKTDVPLEYGLTSVYPNPFNAVSNVGFALDKASNVRLTLHDITGRPVATLLEEHLPVGSYKVAIDGSHLPSGTYFVRLADDAHVSIMKVALLK